MITKCVECGAKFEPFPRKRVCSPKCRRKRHQRQNNERYIKSSSPLLTKICEECGEKFKTKLKFAKYCNKNNDKACYRKANARQCKLNQGNRNAYRRAYNKRIRESAINYDKQFKVYTRKELQGMSVAKFVKTVNRGVLIAGVLLIWAVPLGSF